MKLRLTAMILLSLCLSQAFADEGMWLLGNLRKNKQAERVMKELGLQMPVNKLYNPKKPEWWFPKMVWYLPIITVVSAVSSSILP